MVLQAILYWLSVVGIILIGTLVLVRQRKAVYGYYALFSYGLAAWLVCQYFIDQTANANLWLGLGFIALEIVAPAFLAFVYLFVGHKRVANAMRVLLLLPLVVLGPLSFSGLLVETHNLSSGVDFIFGPLYVVQSAIILGYMLTGFAILFHKYTKTSGNERSQYFLFSMAFLPFLIAAIITGILVPNVGQLQFLRPLGAFIMVLILGYTMVYRKLFDIRSFAIRATVYVLSITAVGFLYGFVAFGLVGRLFFSGQGFNLTQQTVYTLLAVILAFTFQPIQHFFNKYTNRLFYRDGYDAQALIDRLGNLFALEIDFTKITHVSTKLLGSEMKLSHAELLVVNDNGLNTVAYGKTDATDPYQQANLNSLKKKITSIDDLDGDSSYKKLLLAHDISLAVRLITQDGVVGYLMLGPKQSGNTYTAQDINTLTVIGNGLAIAIQNTLLIDRIRRFNLTLQDRVNEATRQLRRTNERLKELDETKDDFISMASHQLRTPLTSVKGYISMVLEGDAGKVTPMQREMLGQAFFSSQRMVYLISDLLNVSRLKTGKFIIEASEVDLVELVQQELHQLEEAAASRSLTLAFDYPKDFPTLMFDETKTRQIIMNFTDNAIYYTPAGGHITVRLVNNPSTIELRVEDNGIGVPKHEQHHLFTKFYRAGNARQARPDGTGLGLFMAKKVIAAQGGSVLFDSVEGKGSTFGFVFSKAKLALPVEAIAPAPAGPPPAKRLSKV